MKSKYKVLGNYIREVDIRNIEDKKDNLLGVSTQKVFIKSIANTVGTNFQTYKVVKKHQFTYVPDTSRRGDKIGLALLCDYEEALVSQAYTVFEVVDKNELLPEYLMMWFRRPEFDRYARYMSHGSVREIFGWEEMCDVKLPVPHIEKQREIVKEYNTIVKRIELNEQISQKLEETAQAIYKQWFIEFEFPDENGQTFKSSGGEMEYCAELDKEIPKGWGVNLLKELCTIKGGKRLPKGESLSSAKNEHPYIKVADMGSSKFVVLNDKFEFVDKITQKAISRYTVSKGDVIISIVGTIGIVKIVENTLDKANLTENCVKLTNLSRVTADYLYHFFYSKVGRAEMEMRTVGGVQGKLPIYNIESFKIICSPPIVMQQFTEKMVVLNRTLQNCILQNAALNQLKSIMLSRLAIIPEVSLTEV